jgi:diacylglycerol kinase
MSRPPVPGEPQKSEWSKFIAGFGYAFSGLWYALCTQRNARVHVAIATLAIVMGIVLRISAADLAIIFIAIASVFIAELFNTVFELCVDLASPHYHPLAKRAKDIAAGAVLLSAVLAVVIGLLVLGPPLWNVIYRYFNK